MKVYKLLSLLFALLISQSSFANTIYVEYDPSCMDRYEYKYANSSSGFNHIVYHIRLNDQQKVVLEVGIENRVNQRARPSDVKSCSDLSMNERFVKQVNKGDIQLYLVRRNGNEYNVSPVGLASYAQITPTMIGYSSLDHIFAYNYNQAANGKNIATSSSAAKVYYNGTVSYSCPKKYQFTKIRNRAGKNYTEMSLIPEIGVVEEKVGFNQTDAENNKMELVSVNNIPLQQYLDGFCQGKELNYKPQGVFYSSRGNVTAPSSNTMADLESGRGRLGTLGTPSTPTTTTPTTTTYPTTTTTTTTPVTETRKCNVYKDLDRGVYIDWSTGQPANTTCGGNTFRNGVMLGASTTVVTAPTTTTTIRPVETRPAVDPRPYTPPPVTSVVTSNCPEVSGNGYHVVQKNETLYSIARLYGVSHKQIARINNIRNMNKISPCTKLKIREYQPVAVDNTPDPEDWKRSNGTHVVSKGETIYRLAKKYGYSPARFKAMNNLGPNDPIYVGQILKTNDCNCPAPGSTSVAGATYAPANIPVPAEYNVTGNRIETRGENTTSKRKVHIVKENETLYNIAKMYGISESRLRSLNKIEENEIIYPFQRLYVN